MARAKTAKIRKAATLHESLVSKMATRRVNDDVRALFGKNLHKLMIEHGVSQSDLARHCFGTVEENGFQVAAGRDRISKYLRGKSFPEYATLAKMAEKFDIDLDDLLPPSVRTALEGTPSPIVQFEPITETLFSVRFNAEFTQEFIYELVKLVARYRGQQNINDAKRRKTR